MIVKATVDTIISKYYEPGGIYKSYYVISSVGTNVIVDNYNNSTCLVFYGFNDIAWSYFIKNSLTEKDSAIISNWLDTNHKTLVESINKTITNSTTKILNSDSINKYYEIKKYLNIKDSTSYFVVNSTFSNDSPYQEYGQSIVCAIVKSQIKVLFEQNWNKRDLETDIQTTITNLFSINEINSTSFIIDYLYYDISQSSVFILPQGGNKFVCDTTYISRFVED